MEPAPQKIRILIIDDQLVVREGLRLLMENHPGIKVAAMVSTREEALAIVASQTFDLIILNLELGTSALSFIPELREAASKARMLVLTGLRDSETHQKVVELGAMGVVLKEQAADLLLKAIEKVYQGEVWLDRLSVGQLLRRLTTSREKDLGDPHAKKISSLTERERQVIALITQGLRNKQIAERLFISQTTVTHHLSSIYSKLGVTDRLELVVYAFANKLAKMPE